MADDSPKFSLSKLNFFSRLDARARVLVLFLGIVGIIFLVYLGTKFFSGESSTTGPSRVANAPQGLQSVPGSQVTPEYQRAIEQANVQSAQQAQMTGGSAVPTLINYGSAQGPAGQCNIICSDESANVKYNLDDWVRQGKLAPDIATALQQLANRNVAVNDYAAQLDQLVKAGKLTPEQARELLEQYKKQHANSLLQDSAKMMDGLIKAGQLPLDAANQLLTAQKNNMSPSDYAALLQQLVRAGSLSPEVAQQLLTQYSQQRAREIIMQSIAVLNQMTRSGQLLADVEKDLVDLEGRMVSIDSFSATLQKYVASGKLAPVVAEKILDEYKEQKASIGPSLSINQMLQQAEAAAYQEINDLLKAGKITEDVANQLRGLIQRNVSFDDFQSAVNQLVQQKKLTPEIAKLKLADYRLVKGLRDLLQNLNTLQGNNASPSAYADALKAGVLAGLLTPEQASQLMQEYQAMLARGPAGPTTPAATEAFAKLQQRVQQNATTQPNLPITDFTVPPTAAVPDNTQEKLARIQALMSAMSGQAQQLIGSWQAPVMVHKAGVETKTTKETTVTQTSSGGRPGLDGLGASGAPIIKAGTILFAVLDTAVNSDYPDTPVMATIVAGKYKGAKLLGRLQTTKSVSGQLDRVSLTFNLMNMDAWSTSKSITAFAIDPDTARTVIASSVNYHYLLRFGSIMATSFVQGYANAINTSSSTTTTGIFGTSTTHPELSPGQKLASAVGQIGQTLGQVTQNYVNIPPTVRVESGVGLGILFMSDVTPVT